MKPLLPFLSCALGALAPSWSQAAVCEGELAWPAYAPAPAPGSGSGSGTLIVSLQSGDHRFEVRTPTQPLGFRTWQAG